MKSNTYLNPVYAGSFPDPFVLKYGGIYYGYCTGTRPDGRVFGVLRSPDLVNWEELPGAMTPLSGDHPMYWAPEVTYYNGLFYLYYSAGNEVYMELRVAVSAQPEGPFEDSGHVLTTQQFAIDAHVFKDDDGAFYLFYATDFLDYPRIGTGTVMDRLLDPFTPEGKPRPVTRAKYDWQIYDPNRPEKGNVRWHTIEGSFVLKHRAKYYQMFSGGNWTNPSYGVSYGITESLDRPDEWDQVADGESVLPVLRTIPGKVTGPGHNSVVRGPDNRQLYCVYHRWSPDGSVRQMAIDPLDYAGERLIVLGPTYQEQLATTRPLVNGFANFAEEIEGKKWHTQGGYWQVEEGTLYQRGEEEAAAYVKLDYRNYLLEIELKALADQPGGYGLGFNRGEDGLFSLLLEPGDRQVRLIWQDEENLTQEQTLPLPEGFNPNVFHLLRLEVQNHHVSLQLDGVPVTATSLTLCCKPNFFRLVTLAAPAAFSGFALTPGFEDAFPLPEDTKSLDWQPDVATEDSRRDPFNPVTDPPIFTKGDLLLNYELALNVLLENEERAETAFFPAWTNQGSGPKFLFNQGPTGWQIETGQDEPLSFPPGFDPSIYQQFRFRKEEGSLTVFWEHRLLGQVAIPDNPARVGLINPTGKTFEMVRVTAL